VEAEYLVSKPQTNLNVIFFPRSGNSVISLLINKNKTPSSHPTYNYGFAGSSFLEKQEICNSNSMCLFLAVIPFEARSYFLMIQDVEPPQYARPRRTM